MFLLNWVPVAVRLRGPEIYLYFAVSFGGGGGVVGSADVIEGERGPPRLGQRRQLDLVPHVLVVGVEGVGSCLSPRCLYHATTVVASLQFY